MSHRYGESIFPRYCLKIQGTCVIPMFLACHAQSFRHPLGLGTFFTDL